MFVGFCKKMEMQGIDPHSLGKSSHALPFELYPPLIYIYIYIIPHIHYKGHRVKKERIIKGHRA